VAGHNRPKDGVASLADVPAILAFVSRQKGVDARHGPGMTRIALRKKIGIAFWAKF